MVVMLYKECLGVMYRNRLCCVRGLLVSVMMRYRTSLLFFPAWLFARW